MSKQRGFTLIELMIVIAVVAILAGVALPSYNNYVTRARLGEARSLLESNRIRMEQYFQDTRTYVGLCGANFPVNPANSNWTITCGDGTLAPALPGPTPATYTLVAIASATAPPSLAGFRFSINEASIRSTDNVPANSEWVANNGCWVTRTGGQCN